MSARHVPYHQAPKRFVVRREPEHPCCYSYSVHDTHERGALIAETLERHLAERIAEAMNKAEGGVR